MEGATRGRGEEEPHGEIFPNACVSLNRAKQDLLLPRGPSSGFQGWEVLWGWAHRRTFLSAALPVCGAHLSLASEPRKETLPRIPSPGPRSSGEPARPGFEVTEALQQHRITRTPHFPFGNVSWGVLFSGNGFIEVRFTRPNVLPRERVKFSGLQCFRALGNYGTTGGL